MGCSHPLLDPKLFDISGCILQNNANKYVLYSMDNIYIITSEHIIVSNIVT